MYLLGRASVQSHITHESRPRRPSPLVSLHIHQHGYTHTSTAGHPDPGKHLRHQHEEHVGVAQNAVRKVWRNLPDQGPRPHGRLRGRGRARRGALRREALPQVRRRAHRRDPLRRARRPLHGLRPRAELGRGAPHHRAQTHAPGRRRALRRHARHDQRAPRDVGGPRPRRRGLGRRRAEQAQPRGHDAGALWEEARLPRAGGAGAPDAQGMEDATSEAMQRPNRPGFLNWLVYGGKFRRATAAMRAYAADLVEHRRTNPSDRKDLLAAMLSAEDPETGRALTGDQVIDEIVSMPIGSSTAPCLVSTAIYLMLKNPRVVTAAREELDGVVGDGELAYGHLSQLKYVEGVVRESLRLSFAAPGFNIEPIPRQGDKSPVLLAGGKYEVAHDQAMIIVLAGVNRDPSVFEDPLGFKPERMVGDRYEELPLGVRRFYGNGKRECIGKHYAWLWEMIVLAKLIKEVDFSMADPSYHLEQDGWFNLRPVNFKVKVQPRKSTKNWTL
ncbi:Bifunctional cytochrome P450/NADPH--P450 reductase [Colletotrichum sidae]|uniref:Bifunctional cytochrome P450/NADPH--P450 reductase n=1 Tax=Colletotrichum sidae TaxID=1347389 RepID=A0A4R8THG8_9PEZI|nr:Bifunctional cytochrome P450/NADPH--P450 reductase [Colletotrichum sidae]